MDDQKMIDAANRSMQRVAAINNDAYCAASDLRQAAAMMCLGHDLPPVEVVALIRQIADPAINSALYHGVVPAILGVVLQAFAAGVEVGREVEREAVAENAVAENMDPEERSAAFELAAAGRRLVNAPLPVSIEPRDHEFWLACRNMRRVLGAHRATTGIDGDQDARL